MHLCCVCLCCRLSLNRSGGQCLDELGARVRRWCWSNLSLTPTPLYPVFLSLNKTVGVRVLGKEKVFVSFLARGQQAKFSVGTCIQVKVDKIFLDSTANINNTYMFPLSNSSFTVIASCFTVYHLSFHLSCSFYNQ